ncbi:ABC transporter-like protein [Trypanosoma rangeli]|uniref:ABC transporter-like protein n=1 Tax=Trypanosoma rangeli TaxID=5698 RepID=A0A422MY30_TRYRA|nr:ABC transporter-like protein [Trypanosoma rangeli]RNE98123.1 ABC transporter-like protein [Trypanosoma rangeli]|eukprot:RNE98123.1 ABC transporter-like protein [Trypanosoma rangeli]
MPCHDPISFYSASNDVDDLDFTTPTGAITAIHGPSASSKSTYHCLYAGLTQQQKNRVKTHANIALMRQEQAILFGSIRDTLPMVHQCKLTREERGTARGDFFTVIQHSCCGMYIRNPYQTPI